MKKVFKNDPFFTFWTGFCTGLLLFGLVGWADVVWGGEGAEEITIPKIKAMFWDEYRNHATEQVQVDLDNGQTITIVVGEEMPQYQFKIDSDPKQYQYQFKIDSDPKQDKDCRWELIFQLIDHLRALEERVKVLEDKQIDWGSGVTRWIEKVPSKYDPKIQYNLEGCR